MQTTFRDEIASKDHELKELARKYHVAAIKIFGNVLGNRFPDPADIHFLITPAQDANQIDILTFEQTIKELFLKQIVKVYTEESLRLMVEERMLSAKMREDAINTAIELENF